MKKLQKYYKTLGINEEIEKFKRDIGLNTFKSLLRAKEEIFRIVDFELSLNINIDLSLDIFERERIENFMSDTHEIEENVQLLNNDFVLIKDSEHKIDEKEELETKIAQTKKNVEEFVAKLKNFEDFNMDALANRSSELIKNNSLVVKKEISALSFYNLLIITQEKQLNIKQKEPFGPIYKINL